jgi:hypothetical protein
MHTKYNIILFLFTYISYFHGLGAEYYLLAKNGSILTTNQNIIENQDPEVVAVMIYENNVNKTGFDFVSHINQNYFKFVNACNRN